MLACALCTIALINSTSLRNLKFSSYSHLRTTETVIHIDLIIFVDGYLGFIDTGFLFNTFSVIRGTIGTVNLTVTVYMTIGKSSVL